MAEEKSNRKGEIEARVECLAPLQDFYSQLGRIHGIGPLGDSFEAVVAHLYRLEKRIEELEGGGDG